MNQIAIFIAFSVFLVFHVAKSDTDHPFQFQLNETRSSIETRYTLGHPSIGLYMKSFFFIAFLFYWLIRKKILFDVSGGLVHAVTKNVENKVAEDFLLQISYPEGAFLTYVDIYVEQV